MTGQLNMLLTTRVQCLEHQERKGFQAGEIGQQFEIVQRIWEMSITFSKLEVSGNF